MPTNYSTKEVKAKAAAAGKPEVKKLNIATRTKQVSATDKLLKRFIKTDAKSLKEYVINDFLIPNCLRLLRDTAVNAIDMLLLGKAGGKSSSGNSGTRDYTSFSGSGVASNGSRWSPEANKQRSIDKLSSIIFNSRGDAEAFLGAIDERIRLYKRCSLLDCFDMLEKTNTSPTDENYGWRSIDGAEIRACQGGFEIIYPRVICIA